jgi:phage I-like protein
VITLDASTSAPKEFRIFRFGKVSTEKGTFAFTEKSGAEVMAAYREHGADLPFDYEHKSVRSDTRAGDGKAAGWFGLELRKDGLWAVGIKWTPPARAAIENKEWRYVSPAFELEGKRITKLINIALTNLPATHNLTALVAASRTVTMDEEEKKKEEASESPEIPLADRIAALEAALAALVERFDKLANVEKDEHGEDITLSEKQDCAEKPEEKQLSADIAKLTGSSDPEVQRGILLAHANSHAQLLASRAQSEDRAKNELAQLLDRGIREGRIVPSQRAQIAALGTQGAKAFLSAAPRRVATLASSEATEPAAPTQVASGGIHGAPGRVVVLSRDGAKHSVTLSAEDVYWAERFGNKLEDVAAAILDRKFTK